MLKAESGKEKQKVKSKKLNAAYAERNAECYRLNTEGGRKAEGKKLNAAYAERNAEC
jgi:hypothetical protein